MQRRLASWCLVLALLPSIAFLGHWGVSIPLPRELGDVVLLPSAGHEQHGHDHGVHENHCHADASSCSDVPFAAVNAFALLREAAATPAHTLGTELASTSSLPLFPVNTVSPEKRPPRVAVPPVDFSPA